MKLFKEEKMKMKESQKRLCLRAGKSGWIFLMLLFVILFSRANTHAVVREFRVQGFDIIHGKEGDKYDPYYRGCGDQIPIDFDMNEEIDVMVGFGDADKFNYSSILFLGVYVDLDHADILIQEEEPESPFLEGKFYGKWVPAVPFGSTIGEEILIAGQTDNSRYQWKGKWKEPWIPGDYLLPKGAYTPYSSDSHYLSRNYEANTGRANLAALVFEPPWYESCQAVGFIPETEGVIGVRFFQETKYEDPVAEFARYGYIHYRMKSDSEGNIRFSILGWAYETDYCTPIVAEPLAEAEVSMASGEVLEFQLTKNAEGELIFSWEGEPGEVYQLERAENPEGLFEEWGEEIIVPETDNGNQPVSMTQRLSSEDTSEQCFWRIKRVK